ncbi:MAG: hypothetical protein JSV57_01255 [Candidatus Bathyarchaeota archaeon]|nr:MAG: hypothetical protein JSV57_01255 [Candidatus Bathyarchaeota archaeon]
MLTFSVSASVSREDALSAVSEAEQSLAGAYEAVVEAEEVGGNASRLLAQLGVAGEHLAGAYNALRKGDFSGAVDDANRCRESAEDVETDAAELKILAPQERRQHFLSWMISSSIGICCIAVGSIISWYGFKHRYNRGVARAKPEAGEDGA